MSGKTDQIRGRIKEAVGKVKVAAEKVVDKVKDA